MVADEDDGGNDLTQCKQEQWMRWSARAEQAVRAREHVTGYRWVINGVAGGWKKGVLERR